MSTIRLFFIKQLLRRVKRRADYTNILLARRGFEKLVARFNKPLPDLTYTTTDVGGMKAEWIVPKGADESKVLLFFHGGGYATGSINTHRALVSQLAKNANIKALLFDYRLAPENKYPAPIEDAVTVYQCLLQNGFSPSQVAFGGDSAGGGMSIGTLLYCRDHHIPLPKCAIALSPWLDQTMSGNSYLCNRDLDPMLVAEGFPLWSNNYLGDADSKSPYASPIFHDLKGLPPIYIQVGAEEILLDDSTRFEKMASEDGVTVLMEIYPKMFHVFNAFWRILPEARSANKKLGQFIVMQLKEGL